MSTLEDELENVEVVGLPKSSEFVICQGFLCDPMMKDYREIKVRIDTPTLLSSYSLSGHQYLLVHIQEVEYEEDKVDLQLFFVRHDHLALALTGRLDEKVNGSEVVN